MTDWTRWHADYDDPSSALSRRRVIVRQALRSAIDDHARETLTVISMCSGDGLDVITELASRPERLEKALLVESDPALAVKSRSAAADAGLSGRVITRCADAADTSNYSSYVPADLLLACGLFGNIADVDVFATITHLPELVARNAVVVWTRTRRLPDLTPAIREHFRAVGFTELTFVAPPDVLFSVGAVRFDGTPQPFVPARHLFTFVN